MMRPIPPFYVAVVLLLLTSRFAVSQLQVGFYADKCRLAEFIVKDEVKKAFFMDKGIAPGLVRMHFHDCFVRVISH